MLLLITSPRVVYWNHTPVAWPPSMVSRGKYLVCHSNALLILRLCSILFIYTLSATCRLSALVWYDVRTSASYDTFYCYVSLDDVCEVLSLYVVLCLSLLLGVGLCVCKHLCPILRRMSHCIRCNNIEHSHRIKTALEKNPRVLPQLTIEGGRADDVWFQRTTRVLWPGADVLEHIQIQMSL